MIDERDKRVYYPRGSGESALVFNCQELIRLKRLELGLLRAKNGRTFDAYCTALDRTPLRFVNVRRDLSEVRRAALEEGKRLEALIEAQIEQARVCLAAIPHTGADHGPF